VTASAVRLEPPDERPERVGDVVVRQCRFTLGECSVERTTRAAMSRSVNSGPPGLRNGGSRNPNSCDASSGGQTPRHTARMRRGARARWGVMRLPSVRPTMPIDGGSWPMAGRRPSEPGAAALFRRLPADSTGSLPPRPVVAVSSPGGSPSGQSQWASGSEGGRVERKGRRRSHPGAAVRPDDSVVVRPDGEDGSSASVNVRERASGILARPGRSMLAPAAAVVIRFEERATVRAGSMLQTRQTVRFSGHGPGLVMVVLSLHDRARFRFECAPA